MTGVVLQLLLLLLTRCWYHRVGACVPECIAGRECCQDAAALTCPDHARRQRPSADGQVWPRASVVTTMALHVMITMTWSGLATPAAAAVAASIRVPGAYAMREGTRVATLPGECRGRVLTK